MLTNLIDSELLVYAEKDFDHDLIEEEDLCTVRDLFQAKENKESIVNLESKNANALFAIYNLIKENKETQGWENIRKDKKVFYNAMNWVCLRRKGHTMINSYYKKILPKIKEVLAVQHKFKLINDVGDEIVAIADLIVKWEDGRILLLDNKTSAKEYEKDQASRSQQLIIYYHQLKEEFKLDAVGFIVMNKSIVKNKIKICSVCGHDGTGSRARTCDVEYSPSMGAKAKRCGGDWLTKCSPEAWIQTIINNVSDTAENLVLSSFDEANNGISKGVFYKNLNSCKGNGSFRCPFFEVCWKQDYSQVVNSRKTNGS